MSDELMSGTFHWVFDEEPETGFTDDEVNAILTASPTQGMLTASAEHTGAMIALVPSDADLERLALAGGEPLEELHLTLAFLGEAADIPEEMRQRIIDEASYYFDDVISTEAFSVNVFNPHNPEMNTAIVLGIRGEDLIDPRSNVVSAVRGFFSMPAQHEPWIPHVTMAYTDDLNRSRELTAKLGPITFDKIRFAFGGEVTDIHLGPLTAGFFREREHPRDKAGVFVDSRFSTLIKKALTGKDAIKATPKPHAGYTLAIRNYQTGHDRLINEHLRTGGKLNPGQDEGWSSTRTFLDLKEMMSHSTTTKDIQVFRGVKDPSSIFGDSWQSDGDNSGLTWNDKGYASTTTDEATAKKLFADGNTVMRVFVPKGTHAAFLSPTDSLAEDENEILLDRDLSFRIVQDHGVGTDGIRHLDVEVLAKENSAP